MLVTTVAAGDGLCQARAPRSPEIKAIEFTSNIRKGQFKYYWMR